MTRKKSSAPSDPTKDSPPDCFVVMPIADMEGYDTGHFGRVYRNIIIPSCKQAGFKPIRADDVGRTNLIHVDILKQLLHAKMVICDLSGRNPNVLFELGLRQAFDKPTVLIQEKGTVPIFDISSLRYTEYSRHMRYDDVLAVQEELADSLKETYDHRNDDSNVNSIVRLLSLTEPAQSKPPKDPQAAQMGMILSELQSLKGLMQTTETIAEQNTSEDIRKNDFTKELNILLKNAELTFQRYLTAADRSFSKKEASKRMENLRNTARRLEAQQPSSHAKDIICAIENYLTVMQSPVGGND